LFGGFSTLDGNLFVRLSACGRSPVTAGPASLGESESSRSRRRSGDGQGKSPPEDPAHAHLADKGRSPLTIKAACGDLIGFATWWEARFSRPFAPALLRERHLRAWRLARQKDEGAAPATINRALVTLRAYCTWAQRQGLITENPADEIKPVPTSQPLPKSLPAEAVDAILRAVRSEMNERIRLRDEALLALLIYTGLRAGGLRGPDPRSRSGWWHCHGAP
jgi:hypothetical protein